MKLGTRLSGVLLIGLLCAAGFGLVAYLVGADRVKSFDDIFIHFFQGMESPGLTRVMVALGFIGSTKPVIMIAVAAMLLMGVILHHRKELILFVFATGGSALLNMVLKAAFLRERPTIYRIVEETGYSFPSGHTMGAFSLYGILTYLLWKHIPVLWGRIALITASVALIIMMGISRIYLGVHYPSDIVGGLLASGCWLAAGIWVYRSYTRTKPYEYSR